MRRVLLVVVAFALIASACSDDDASDGTSSAAGAPRPIESTDQTGPSTTTTLGARVSGEPPLTTTGEGESVPAAGPAVVPITDLRFELEPIGTFEQPLDLIGRPGDPALYVAEKTGRVRRVVDGVVDPEPFLDLSRSVSTNSERGLLGIAFTPEGDRFVASFTDPAGASVLASWPVDDTIDLSGAIVHLTVEQPFSNHNGGDIAYGPDGYLYWALGDGGSADDPLDSGQDTTTLLGSMLRLELTNDGAIPAPGNPLSERPELWLWGLRNPWRFSFDRMTGEMWIGDVGQGRLEEIDLIAPDPEVRNLGWRRYEGTNEYLDSPDIDHHPPIVEYTRQAGRSVTGGYVYRGTQQPHLDGIYFYGDFGSGWVRGLRQVGGVVTEHAEVLGSAGAVSSFGEDSDGEIYVVSFGGEVSRLVATPAE